MPTLANHMGRLQQDTETMAEGLGQRVKHLVEGYQQLNDIAAQAPVGIMQAASDYSKALTRHPLAPMSTPNLNPDQEGQKGGGNGLDLESLHRELFALHERKLSLDKNTGEDVLGHLAPPHKALRRRHSHAHSTRVPVAPIPNPNPTPKPHPSPGQRGVGVRAGAR
ncbi:unnamed protein product, partial [Discosporangium mesarthrocarpum]